MTLNREANEMVKYNTIGIDDKFGWLMNTRGLALDLLDAEENNNWAINMVNWIKPALEDLKERGLQQKQRVNGWNHYISDDLETSYSYELVELRMLRDQYRKLNDLYEEVKTKLDLSQSTINRHEAVDVDDPDDTPDEPGYNTSHWNMVWSEWETIYDYLLSHKLSLSYCAFMFDLLDVKLKRREITTYHFAKVGLYLAGRLGWDKEICRMKKLNKKLKGKPNQPGRAQTRLVSFEDRYYGEMAFSENTLVDAIDIRSAASTIGCSVYDLLPEELEHDGYNDYNEHTSLLDMLIAADMNKSEVARQLGVSRSTIYRRFKKAIAAAAK